MAAVVHVERSFSFYLILQKYIFKWSIFRMTILRATKLPLKTDLVMPPLAICGFSRQKKSVQKMVRSVACDWSTVFLAAWTPTIVRMMMMTSVLWRCHTRRTTLRPAAKVSTSALSVVWRAHDGLELRWRRAMLRLAVFVLFDFYFMKISAFARIFNGHKN